ncbi:MAG: Asp-tRNA(Asn)/Glu-tRNA(Gln) amidotransferase subunit GatA [Armatimonadota bacterium]|nr:MAG: Asp-tRNA(Asn)/Glu-tRNA(Gln) amidotransferase subunit GatA [Armatimonadota bacterium]
MLLTAAEAGRLIAARELSSVELTRACLERMRTVEGDVHAFVRVTDDLALSQAAEIDRRMAAGENLGPLAGVPIALKDILCTRGVPTTCCSRILENYVPPYDATVIQRLKQAGLVFLGKTNMDEFAMGSSTENSAFGPTHNPWDLARVPGGSSGGSAAALAALEAPLAIGTDTGGSIRQPAAFCGVTGLKPTYGRVSRYGLVAFASSLDQIGPMARDVRDCALLLQVLAGHDPLDSTSIAAAVPDYAAVLEDSVKDLRVGVPTEFFEYRGSRVSGEVEDAVRAAARVFEGLGAACDEVSTPHLQYVIPVYYIIAPAEASSNLARYDGVAYGHRTPRGAADVIELYEETREEGFGPEVKRRIMLGTYALSAGYYDAYYLKASQVRTLIRRDFEKAFENHDLLVAPVTPSLPFRLGEKTDDPVQMYISDVCTIAANMAGLPAISIPAGYADGLPIGLQIIGKPLDEATVLRAAYAFQQAADFHRLAPLDAPGRDGVRAVVAWERRGQR